jgi:hypothetical protein
MCTPKGRSPHGVFDAAGDGAGDPAGIGASWHDSLKKRFGSAARNPHMGRLAFRNARLIRRTSGMGEIIRTSRKCARHDDLGLYTPARQLAGVLNGERIHTRLGGDVR